MGSNAPATYELMSESLARVAFRHGGNADIRTSGNFGFLDGHVETLRINQCQGKTTNGHYRIYFEGWKGKDNFLYNL